MMKQNKSRRGLSVNQSLLRSATLLPIWSTLRHYAFINIDAPCLQ